MLKQVDERNCFEKKIIVTTSGLLVVLITVKEFQMNIYIYITNTTQII